MILLMSQVELINSLLQLINQCLLSINSLKKKHLINHYQVINHYQDTL